MPRLDSRFNRAQPQINNETGHVKFHLPDKSRYRVMLQTGHGEVLVTRSNLSVPSRTQCTIQMDFVTAVQMQYCTAMKEQSSECAECSYYRPGDASERQRSGP